MGRVAVLFALLACNSAVFAGVLQATAKADPAPILTVDNIGRGEVSGYAIASAYHPAHEVGGDFFQIISFNDETTLVAIGDVSGKGSKPR
jgi:hypothetical protein